MSIIILVFVTQIKILIMSGVKTVYNCIFSLQNLSIRKFGIYNPEITLFIIAYFPSKNNMVYNDIFSLQISSIVNFRPMSRLEEFPCGNSTSNFRIFYHEFLWKPPRERLPSLGIIRWGRGYPLRASCNPLYITALW